MSVHHGQCGSRTHGRKGESQAKPVPVVPHGEKLATMLLCELGCLVWLAATGRFTPAAQDGRRGLRSRNCCVR